ncbi:hypothetical protein ACCS64_39270, partial [Rhizobium ruizarguesonis]
FERRRNGAESTKAAKALLPFTLDIEERIDSLLKASQDIAAHTQPVFGMAEAGCRQRLRHIVRHDAIMPRTRQHAD